MDYPLFNDDTFVEVFEEAEKEPLELCRESHFSCLEASGERYVEVKHISDGGMKSVYKVFDQNR